MISMLERLMTLLHLQLQLYNSYKTIGQTLVFVGQNLHMVTSYKTDTVFAPTWPIKMAYAVNELPELLEITSSMERNVEPM